MLAPFISQFRTLVTEVSRFTSVDTDIFIPAIRSVGIPGSSDWTATQYDFATDRGISVAGGSSSSGSVVSEYPDLVIPTSPESVILYYMVALGACLLVCYVLCPRDVKSPKLFSHTVVWALVVIPILIHSYTAVSETLGTVHDRWFGFDVSFFHGSGLYLACQVWGVILDFKNPVMLLHHVISLAAIGGGLFHRRLAFYASLSLFCEITNIPLDLMFLMKQEASEESVKDGASGNSSKKSDKKEKKIARFAQFIANIPGLNVLNGLTLCNTFLIFRILLFPFFLVLWTFDIVYFRACSGEELERTILLSYISPFCEHVQIILQPILGSGFDGTATYVYNNYPATCTQDSKSFGEITWYELIVYPIVIFILLLLSSLWFYRIVLGLLKVLGLLRPKFSTKKASGEVSTNGTVEMKKKQ